jgi:hypothetical protein
MILALFATPATAFSAEEKSEGPWDISRVTCYRAHPSETTAKLKWCVENSKGDAECGAAMQACGDLIRENPKAECQSLTAR